MILKNKGETYMQKNVTYKIGQEILDVEDGPYCGLIGTITEIRTGKDKETNNVSTDVYCTFDLPAFPHEVDILIEKFSKLHGSPISVDEINLEQVIMAPRMIIPILNDKSDAAVHLISEEWNGDSGADSRHYVYLDSRQAKAKARQLVRERKTGGIISEILDEYDFVEESADTYYSCWRDNDYDGYHYNLFLEEIEAVGKEIKANR